MFIRIPTSEMWPQAIPNAVNLLRVQKKNRNKFDESEKKEAAAAAITAVNGQKSNVFRSEKKTNFRSGKEAKIVLRRRCRSANGN